MNRAFAQVGRPIFLPAGRYRITGNLTKPACAGICGEGAQSSIIEAMTGVTKALALGGACTTLSEFKIIGNSTPNATGIAFGDTEAGSYVLNAVRVEGFTGTDAVGVHANMVLKSQFNRLVIDGCSTNLLVSGIGGFPTTLEFNAFISEAALGVGIRIVTGHSIVFNLPTIESSAREGLVVQPRLNDSAEDVVINNPWFEDNHSGETNYQLLVDGSAGGATTARNSRRVLPSFLKDGSVDQVDRPGNRRVSLG